MKMMEDERMNIFRRPDEFDKSFPQAEIDKITKQNASIVNLALDEFIAKNAQADTGAIESFRRDIREMISSVDERIHYWEARRTEFLQLSTAMLAASIVGIVAILPSVLSRKQLFAFPTYLDLPVLIAGVFLFFGSTWLIYLWNKQNNPSYPFTKGYKVWRWHYRHAEKNPLDTNVFDFDQTTFNEQVRLFAENMTDYKIKTLKANSKELIDEDLSQLYVLITNEKFKIKFVSQLRDALMNTLFLALVVGVVSIVILAAITYY